MSIFQWSEGSRGWNCITMPTFVKSLQLWPRYRDFSIFQDGGRRHLGFSKFKFLTVGTVTRVKQHHCGNFRQNCSHRGRDRYVSFNIVLVWLENAYSHPFWVFWGFPNDVTHHPNPQKDHPWAEPRHLSHKPRIFSY